LFVFLSPRCDDVADFRHGYRYNPIKTIKTNSIGTVNMLGLAHRVGARMLTASTSEVYGDPEVHPQTEDYRGNVNPIGPRACYDEGKRIAETMCCGSTTAVHAEPPPLHAKSPPSPQHPFRIDARTGTHHAEGG